MTRASASAARTGLAYVEPAAIKYRGKVVYSVKGSMGVLLFALFGGEGEKMEGMPSEPLNQEIPDDLYHGGGIYWVKGSVHFVLKSAFHLFSSPLPAGVQISKQNIH